MIERDHSTLSVGVQLLPVAREITRWTAAMLRKNVIREVDQKDW